MAEIAATCDVFIAGTRIPDGSTGDDPHAPVILSGLAIRWGRSTTVDQPEAATCSLDILDQGSGPTRVDAMVALGASVVVQSTVTGQGAVIVFAGRVTDLDIKWSDDGAGGGVCKVIAADLLADLANRYVGAEPWAQETLSARVGRILTSAGIGATPVSIDPRPAALQVSRADVDRQPALNLLRELAVSGTAVLWVVVPTSTAVPELRIEDPSARQSMRALVQSLPSLLWTVAASASESAPLDACAVLRDPIVWSRSTADLITRVTVRWLDQTTSPDPTERSVMVLDAADEATYGARGISVGTILTSSTDATNAANIIEASHKPGPTWRVEGLTWDLAHTPISTASAPLAVTLLDNQARIGLPLVIGPMPGWAPAGAQAGAYIEGGTYTYRQGRWVLALDGLPATGLGGSLTYRNTDPSIRYMDVDPTLTFLDLIGVGRRGNLGPAWSDMPDGLTWASVPAGNDWSEDPRP